MFGIVVSVKLSTIQIENKFEIMDFSLLLKCFLLLSFCSENLCKTAENVEPTFWAISIRTLLRAIAKPGHITVMACWKSGKLL